MTFYQLEAVLHAKRSGGATNVVIIDVRDGDEVEDSGKIEFSINIPSNELKSALNMKSSDFQKKYGHPKLKKANELIFYCSKTARGAFAADYFYNEGYRSLKYLHEGYKGWIEKEQIADEADL